MVDVDFTNVIEVRLEGIEELETDSNREFTARNIIVVTLEKEHNSKRIEHKVTLYSDKAKEIKIRQPEL